MLITVVYLRINNKQIEIMKSNERILKRLETLKKMYSYNKVVVKSLNEQIKHFKEKTN